MIYIETGSMDPAFNFALEYYLMKNPDFAGDYFLFWRTSPTLMIGRYQITTAEINEPYAKEKNITVVRRVSGGGTIYTDPGGWQFSFIIKGDPNETDFRHYTAPVIQALGEIGVIAYFNNRNDLLIDGRKFSGNAQHRTKDCILHHGSILFDTDIEEMVRSITVADDKIISKGIQSVRQRVTNVTDHMEEKITPTEFKDLMLGSLLKNTESIYELTDADKKEIEKIADEKFRSWDWNYGSSPAYEITKSRRFDGGKLEVYLSLEKGHIRDVHINGDFFFYGDIDHLTQSLIGCPYREEDIRAALQKAMKEDSFYMITLDELVSCII
jgi:lipoate-protein ligase A